MTGFRSIPRHVPDLLPGDRVVWGDHYRVVHRVYEMDDGTGHIGVEFNDAPASRYGPNAVVTVLEIVPVDAANPLNEDDA